MEVKIKIRCLGGSREFKSKSWAHEALRQGHKILETLPTSKDGISNMFSNIISVHTQTVV